MATKSENPSLPEQGGRTRGKKKEPPPLSMGKRYGRSQPSNYCLGTKKKTLQKKGCLPGNGKKIAPDNVGFSNRRNMATKWGGQPPRDRGLGRSKSRARGDRPSPGHRGGSRRKIKKDEVSSGQRKKGKRRVPLQTKDRSVKEEKKLGGRTTVEKGQEVALGGVGGGKTTARSRR